MQKSLLLFLAFLTCAEVAQADDLTVSGFGTLGYTHEGRDRIGFMRNTTQPVDEGNSGSWLSDSTLGLQLNYKPNAQFEAIIQAVARDKKNAPLGNSIEWAFLAWHPSEAIDLRAGRMGLDMFLLADYRNVGFAQPWVRPPTEFYGWIPMFSVNGVDAAYNFRAGDTRWRIKTQFGNSATDIPLDATNSFRFTANNARDLTVLAERGPWQFKAGYSVFTAGSQPGTLTSLNAGLGNIATGAPFAAVRSEAAALKNDLWLKGATIRYMSLGTAYDDGTWLMQSEFAHVTSDSRLSPAGNAAYATLGRRFNSLTPYVSLARFKPSKDSAQAINSWSLLGANAVAAQTAAVAAFNNYRIDQSTITLGMRWDINSRTALKTQWDRSHIGSRGYGLWQVNNLVDGNTSQRVDLLSVSLDFVF